MKPGTQFTIEPPIFTTLDELVKSATENRDFFNSFMDSLEFAMKFYKPLKEKS